MSEEMFEPEVVFQQAIIAYRAGQLDKAEEILRGMLEQMPYNDTITGTLGGVLLAMGKAEEGIVQLQEAIRLNADNVDAQLNLGIALQQVGRLDEGYQQIENASKRAPERTDIQFNLANALLQFQKYPEAIELLKLVIKLDPLFIQAYHSLGAVYSFLQKSHEAKQTYEMALTQIPNELNTLILLGNLQADTGQTNEAEKTYLKASQVHVGIFLPHAVLGKFYLDNGKKKQGEAALLKAYTLNPNDANTNVLLGNVYRDFGRHDEAEKHYNRALEINPQDRGALRNLRRLLKAKIPYWHFEMLADVKRNEAYQKAIEKVVSKDSIVLDIGTGSGLLAMMAARAGSENVIACEMHPRLAQTAQEIISLNGYKDVVKVVAEKSTRLKVDQDLPSKANIIISEILDVGVLGEGVLPTIRHALQNLATKDVKLIPAKVNIYGQLIEIPSRSIVNPVKEISGFNLSPFEQYRIPDEYIRITLKAEKYRILSPVTKIIDFDFYNLPQAFPDDQERQLSIDFKINKSGSVQALVFWFDLYLDEEIVVSSRVDGELEHWGQALFCFTNPKNVSEGDSMTISLLQSDQYLGFRM